MSDYRREREIIRWIIDDEIYNFLSVIQACIAGGCITSIFTGHPISDVDIFFRKPEDYEKAIKYFNACENRKYRGTRSICSTEKAQTFVMEHDKTYCPMSVSYGQTYFRNTNDNKEIIIQIVNDEINCGEPEDIINRFDLTVCQAAYDFKTDNFIFGNRFLQDNARRNIVINSECHNVIGIFYRIHKYIKKGYTVSPREYVKLAFMLANKKYKTYKDFIDDLMLNFHDPLIHHLYNKVRYPIGTRCNFEESMMNTPFEPSVIIEWIDEFNVAGPNYPVKEGRDLSKEKNKNYSIPEIDNKGNVIFPDENRSWF